MQMNTQNNGAQEILNILKENNLTRTWLAAKLKMDYDTLCRQLKSPRFLDDVYKACIKIFQKEGLVSSNKDIIENLQKDFLAFTASTEGMLSILTRSFIHKVSDMRLTEKEKEDLCRELEHARNMENEKIDELIINIKFKE